MRLTLHLVTNEIENTASTLYLVAVGYPAVWKITV